jgi:asparagine synthase (glutamine-hydrolysing)
MLSGGRLCIGRVHHGILPSKKQPAADQRNEKQIVFHGELFNHQANGRYAQYALDRYARDGRTSLRDLKGIFHFACYDRANRTLCLVSDKFGLQPLYYTLCDDGIIFAGEVKAVMEDRRVSKAPDYHSVADFFHYGQVLGDKTLFNDVKLLPAGAILEFNLESGKASISIYDDLLDLFSHKGQEPYAGKPNDAVDELIRSIETNAALPDKIGLSLSGGLDSRGILAGLRDSAKGLATYTLGLPGCADERLAARMADVAGTVHEFVPLESSYIQNFEAMAQQMIFLSDGMYHPHESTEILALNYFEKGRFGILLRGHGGEVAKASLAYPVMVGPEVEGMRGPDDILKHLLTITNLVRRDIEIEKLFTPDFSMTMHSAPHASLTASCGRAAEALSGADTCIYYYIKEHIRRQVVASLDIFRSRIEIRMPYIDADFFRTLLHLPLAFRSSGQIHHLLIKQCMPRLVKIPNSNTGAPLDAGPVRLFLTDKMNSLLKKMSVRGYRHYTEFQDWHRRGFKEQTRRILSGKSIRERNLYNLEYLEHIQQMHVSGRRDYGHLLGTIVGLELWFRRFVDVA